MSAQANCVDLHLPPVSPVRDSLLLPSPGPGAHIVGKRLTVTAAQPTSNPHFSSASAVYAGRTAHSVGKAAEGSLCRSAPAPTGSVTHCFLAGARGRAPAVSTKGNCDGCAACAYLRPASPPCVTSLRVPVDLQPPLVRDTLLPSSSLSLIAGPPPSSPPFFLARMGQYGPVRSSAQMVTCPAVGWSLHGAQARTAEGRDRGRRDQPTLRHARPARPRSG